jgi:hypothetical protein
MRKVNSLVAAAVLGIAVGVASADDPAGTPPPKPGSGEAMQPADRPTDMRPAVPGAADKPSVSYPSRTNQINKHVSFVDYYLSESANAAKTLSIIGDGEPGRMDAQLVAEARKNLDGALDKALSHLKHVRGHKTELSLLAPGVEGGAADPATGSATARPSDNRLAKLDELESHVKEARSASRKLAGVKVDDLSATVDGVSTHILAAQQSFRDIAKWTSYTLLDDTSLGAMPVRGDQTGPGGDVQRDVGKPMGTPSAPESSSPAGIEKSKPEPTTPPPRPEPVAPAPGGAKDPK